MRLEIDAAGFCGISEANCFVFSLETLTEDAQSVADSFVAVQEAIRDLPGGVGTLADAVNELDVRVHEDQETVVRLGEVQDNADRFVSDTIDADNAAARQIHAETEAFYNRCPWARPPEPPPEESQNPVDAFIDWLCDTGEAVVDAIADGIEAIAEAFREMGEAVVEAVRDALHGLVNLGELFLDGLQAIGEAIAAGFEWLKNFYLEHADIIRAVIEIVAAVAVVALAVFVTVVTFGAAAGVIAGLVLVGAAVVSGLRKGKEAEENGGSFFSGFAEGCFKSAFSNSIGVMCTCAGIPWYAGAALGTAATFEADYFHAMLDDFQIDSDEAHEIVVDTVTSGIINFAMSGMDELLYIDGVDAIFFDTTLSVFTDMIGDYVLGPMVVEPVLNGIGSALGAFESFIESLPTIEIDFSFDFHFDFSFNFSLSF